MSKPSSQPPLPADRVRRALVIRPRYVGDLCLVLPVIDGLAAHAPGVRIDFLTELPYAPLLEGDPRFEHVIGVPSRATLGQTAALVRRLRGERYDLVLDLFCNPRTAVWTAATGAPVCVGYPNKGWRSRAYHRWVRPRGKSAVRFHLASLEALGWEVPGEPVPRLRVSDEAHERAAALLARAGAPDGERVLFHPGARWPTRRWQEEDFAALARRLLEERPGATALILAGPGEEERARAVAAAVDRSRCRVLADVPLGLLPAAIAACRAYVGGDTGPLHVSVAAGTPTVGIFGRNEPERFFPYPASHGHRAVYTGVWCSPCDLDVCSHTSCLRSITPELVWRALAEILERETPWPAPRDESLGTAAP